MIFADLFFLYIFIPVCALCYAAAKAVDRVLYRAPKGSHYAAPLNENPLENLVLVMFSLIFYAWGEPVYVFLMIASVLMNYFIGLMLERSRTKLVLAVGIALNIGVIAVFKYTDFLIGTVNLLGFEIPQPGIALPIGISFFTFQCISYIIDVYRGNSPAQRNYFDLLLYISMFPQLIAGPIVRYDTIAREISSRRISFSDISDGSFRFLVGLGKKVILANQLSVISGQFLDGDVTSISAGGAWLGIIAYTFQIYFDFSGYSDMAIGLGRCFGFHFDENFNYPYISSTITEFWRRWHISLGSFFRDYVYIPLGGNRRHQVLNLMVVWFLTGLWHGASWNFVLWGVYFGVIVTLEKYTLIKVKDRIPSPLLHIYSLILIVFGWVIFYFEDFSRMSAFIGTLFGAGAGWWDLVAQNSFTGNLWLLLACVIGSLPLGKMLGSLYDKTMSQGSPAAAGAFTAGKILAAAALLIVCTLLLIGDTNNAFLYTRF